MVLDPCCGTGAYLVEVLNKIAETLHDKGGDALIANDLKKAAMSRVFGFEILPAPFVISHLQIGLLLDRFGAPFAENGKERAGVYLTNALTGWEPPTEPKQHLLFPELEMERDAAAEVKQKKPILVILGNPPYNGFAGVRPSRRSATWSRPTRQVVKDVAAPQGQGLNDLYVRFFRMAERRIAEGEQARASSASSPTTPGSTASRSPACASASWTVRPHLDRLPERRQVQDRQADPRRRARPSVSRPSTTARASRWGPQSRLLARSDRHEAAPCGPATGTSGDRDKLAIL